MLQYIKSNEQPNNDKSNQPLKIETNIITISEDLQQLDTESKQLNQIKTPQGMRNSNSPQMNQSFKSDKKIQQRSKSSMNSPQNNIQKSYGLINIPDQLPFQNVKLLEIQKKNELNLKSVQQRQNQIQEVFVKDKAVQVGRVTTQENSTQTDFQQTQEQPKYDFLNAVLKSKISKLEGLLNEELKKKNSLKESKALALSQLGLSEEKIVSQASLIDKLQRQEIELLEKINKLEQDKIIEFTVTNVQTNSPYKKPKQKQETPESFQINQLQEQLKDNKKLIESQQEEITNLDTLYTQLTNYNNEMIRKYDLEISILKDQQEKDLEIKNKEISSLKQDLKILKQKFNSRPPRQEDIERIKSITSQYEQLKASITKKEKLLTQSSNIIQYFQMELENYKKSYNLFNQEIEQGAEILTQIQPQTTINVVTLDDRKNNQKSLLRKQFKPKLNTSVDTQQSNNYDKSRELPFIEISNRGRQVVQQDFNENSIKKYSNSTHIHHSESSERKAKQIQSFINKSQRTGLEKRKKLSLQFQNPLENDKLLFHAQKLVESLYNKEINL